MDDYAYLRHDFNEAIYREEDRIDQLEELARGFMEDIYTDEYVMLMRSELRVGVLEFERYCLRYIDSL